MKSAIARACYRRGPIGEVKDNPRKEPGFGEPEKKARAIELWHGFNKPSRHRDRALAEKDPPIQTRAPMRCRMRFLGISKKK